MIDPCASVKDGAVPQSPKASGAPPIVRSEAYVKQVPESVSRNLPPSNANLPVAAPACSRPHWQLTNDRVLRLGSFDSPTQYCFHLLSFCVWSTISRNVSFVRRQFCLGVGDDGGPSQGHMVSSNPTDA